MRRRDAKCGSTAVQLWTQLEHTNSIFKNAAFKPLHWFERCCAVRTHDGTIDCAKCVVFITKEAPRIVARGELTPYPIYSSDVWSSRVVAMIVSYKPESKFCLHGK